MKHDHSHRRHSRHADPSVIYMPSQLPPYTPPRKEPEVTGSMVIPDDAQLDAELLAHKNIFETQPRISRQARRKALRAEKKAARRSETERFLVGAPSLSEAASLIEADEPHDDIAVIEAPLVAQDVEMAEAETLVMNAPATEAIEAEEDEVLEAEQVEAIVETAGEAEPAEPVALETIAQLISETGPLIVSPDETASELAANDTVAEPEAALHWIEPEQAWEALPEEARIALTVETEEEAPTLAERAEQMDLPTPAQEIAPEHASAISIETMTTPLPRNRALVTHKRHWLLRLVPWLSKRRKAVAPEPAMVQLQELRFELATALRRLDQILDQAA